MSQYVETVGLCCLITYVKVKTIKRHVWLSSYSTWWQMISSCRSSWCICWRGRTNFRKPPSGRWDTTSPEIGFLVVCGKCSRVSRLIYSEWQITHEQILWCSLWFVRAEEQNNVQLCEILKPAAWNLRLAHHIPFSLSGTLCCLLRCWFTSRWPQVHYTY